VQIQVKTRQCRFRTVKREGETEMGKPWGAPTSWDEVCRRAAGRARYHALRRFQRQERRLLVVELLRRYGLVHGVQARISRELGVSEATVSRDVAALLKDRAACPCCGTVVPKERIRATHV
jgi:hypothetical protein